MRRFALRRTSRQEGPRDGSFWRRRLGTPFAVVGRGRDRAILVLADDADPARLRHWLTHCSEDAVTVAARAEDPEWRLADHGSARFAPVGGRGRLPKLLQELPALDAVVSLRPVEELVDTFVTVFPAVRRDGVFVHDRVAAPGPVAPLADVAGVLGDETEPDQRTMRVRGVAKGVGQFVATPKLAAVRSVETYLLKVRDADIEEVLPRREPDVDLEVLAEMPAGECTATGSVDAGDFGAERFRDTLPHPALRTRTYRGPVVLGGQSLVYAGQTAMPDSFRWFLTGNPMNPALVNVDRNFGLLRPIAKPEQHLPGTYYSVDSTFPHHFGHLMTEVISRLWGWDEAKRRHPDLKAAFVQGRKKVGEPELERALFGAYGIAPEDLVMLDSPTSVDAVATATPMWHHAEPYYVHPGMRDVIDRLAHGLTGGAAPEGPDKLFVSRGNVTKARMCRNQADVERHFVERGFTIVYPERLHLTEQARLFRGARVVAGFGGSGMFNMMFAERLEHVIVLSHEEYETLNEHMFSMLLGNDEHYFWSGAEREKSEGGGRDMQAFQSPWEFDFERNRDRLEALLRRC